MARLTITPILLLLTVIPGLHAAEGKWTPAQVLEQDPQWLADLGLQVPPEALWSAEGGGLLEAAVSLGGCSAAFVSPEGLLLTNHHCAFSLIQQHSTPERDLLTEGFLAPDRAAELPGKGTRVTVPHAFRDVSAEIEAAVPEGADDLERHRAMERRSKELVAECERGAHRRCTVAAFDDGLRWELAEMLEFPDVRLVWSPPRAVGDFGGEVDNWMWPRHAGDFSLLRVWADADNQPAEHAPDNRPYRPEHVFPVSGQGLDEGDFVMVAGYPGRTYRRFLAAETALFLELHFPSRAELYGRWIDIMEAASRSGESARIALASRIKGLANGEKNARGQIAGLLRGDVVSAKRRLEDSLLEQARGTAELSAAAAAHREITRLTEERRRTWDRDVLLRSLHRGAVPLDNALEIVRWVREQAKPDLERLPDYQERDRDRLLDSLRNSQNRLHLPTEAELLADLLARADHLPPEHRIGAFEPLLDGRPGSEVLLERARTLLESSAVPELDRRLALFDAGVSELEDLGDPLLELAFALDDELRAMEEASDRRQGALSRLRPAWRRAVAAHLGRPLDPDANSTLRVSFGHVRGYSPRDGVWMLPQTTLAGLLAKHSGEEPFDAPEAVRRAAVDRTAAGRWVDRELGDLPICFLADADTTGGNSGSPVLNGRGELVGVNFDRVWENVANDFGYNPDVARNVSVDIRYMLWMLDAAEGAAARPLLEELGFAEAAAAAPAR